MTGILEGRVAIITGAGGGLGAAHARVFLGDVGKDVVPSLELARSVGQVNVELVAQRGDGPAPRLFEEVEIYRYELVQNGGNEADNEPLSLSVGAAAWHTSTSG